jgi:nitroreductase
MNTTATPASVEQALSWRYATKRFDATKTIPADTWHALEEALRLAPSSFGLQPWHFVVVSNPNLRKELQAHSWNQPQIVEASHLVVITSLKTVTDETIDGFINAAAATRNQTPADLASYRGMIAGFVKHLTETNAIEAWTSRQAYLALGFLLSSAAMLGIDTCPLEGIDPAQYNKLLGLEASPYSTRVACALGYRAAGDGYANAKKVRFAREHVLSYRG